MTVSDMDKEAVASTPPLVSVVMTAYNQERYVREALESVLAQCYGAMELIVVEDGSTDATRAVIEETLADCSLTHQLIFQDNAGQAAALNVGIAAATGTYVALLDGDDYWLPEKLTAMVAFMESTPGGGVYQHQMRLSSGKAMLEVLPSGDVFTQWKRHSPMNLVTHNEMMNINATTSGLCFRREILKTLLPIPEVLKVCPDYYLFVLGLAEGPIYSLPQTLATWRDHAENAGKQAHFSFHTYVRPVVFPVVNAALRERGHKLKLTFCRRAILWEPLRLLWIIWQRRRRK